MGLEGGLFCHGLRAISGGWVQLRSRNQADNLCDVGCIWYIDCLFFPYILYNNVSILPSSRSPASFLVFITNLLSVHLQNIFIIFGKKLRVYLVFVGIRCTFAPAFGKGASLFERSVSVFRFPRLFFQKKTSGKIWKICEKVLNFAAAFAS